MILIAQQGIRVLGTPIGHPDFVAAEWRVTKEHEVRPSVNDSCVRGCFWSTASARACNVYRLSVLLPSRLRRCSKHIPIVSDGSDSAVFGVLKLQLIGQVGQIASRSTPDNPTLQQ